MHFSSKFFLIVCLFSFLSVPCFSRPNVVLVVADDLGYGDLSCHGNAVLRTPHLNKLFRESVRLLNYHAYPMGTPTRAALMTGLYPVKTGAFRSAGKYGQLSPDVNSMGDVFARNGYTTGMIGKWHLGDNAPHRPQDHGFENVIWHRGGGIGQVADVYGNDYFDDSFEVVKGVSPSSKQKQFKGYCTDVFFEESMRFIEANQERPFFLYLSLNAPHSPHRVPQEWVRPYKKKPGVLNPKFYGMIANIDYNLGILRKRIEELGLTEDTIFIFTTDNGTSAGAKFKSVHSSAESGFNAGMRGRKGSVYDGGHRVPFFVYWPEGQLTGGRNVHRLTSAIDVLPTLSELCGLEGVEAGSIDGESWGTILQKGKEDEWGRDALVLQFHGGPWGQSDLNTPALDSVVMTERWRLLYSRKWHLYDVRADPEQKKNVYKQHPKVVERLKAVYQNYWDEVSAEMDDISHAYVGSDLQNPVYLTSREWAVKRGNPPWNFHVIKKLPHAVAPWKIDVKQSGRYRLTLRQWPEAANKAIVGTRAEVHVAGQIAKAEVTTGAQYVVFELDLEPGETELWTYIYEADGVVRSAYFTEVELL